MTTRTEKYWQQRFEQVTEAQLKTGMDYYDEAERLYREAMESIEKDIARWYMRLAVNNQITYADAKKLLTNSQLKDFKLTLKEYIKRGKENGISADWSKSLENASAKYRISRLEALQIQIQQHLEALYGNQLDGMDAAMRKIYSNGYYQTAYELQKGFSTGFDVQQIDEARLERLMSKPWAADGQNFSQRLWSDKDKLINNLQNELVQGLVRGDAQLKIVQSFAKRMNTSLSNAGRLIATESAYFASLGEKDSMKELGVEQYEILATLDRRTSEICRSMDGKVFKMSEFKAGVTAPPLHPWCRSCTVPHIEGLDSGLRAARDDDGKVYYVPGSMKYPEWKEKFVDGGSKEDLQEVTANDKNKVPKTLENFDAYQKQWMKKNIIYNDNQAKFLKQSMQTVFDNNDYSMRIKFDNLEKIVADGRFKNQFETKTSEGSLSADMRRAGCKQLFNADVDNLEPSDFEKYGYLGSKDFKTDLKTFSTPQYGKTIVQFNKGKLQNRVTYTVGDSLGPALLKRTIAGFVDDFTLAGIGRQYQRKLLEHFMLNVDDKFKNANLLAQKISTDYFELQYHGELTIDDVERICIEPNVVVPDSLLDKLKAKGIKVYQFKNRVGDYREL